MNLRHIHLEKKNQHDTHSRKCREKERDTRNLKKAELQLKVAEEGLNHTRTVYDKLKAQVGTWLAGRVGVRLGGWFMDEVESGSGWFMDEVESGSGWFMDEVESGSGWVKLWMRF